MPALRLAVAGVCVACGFLCESATRTLRQQLWRMAEMRWALMVSPAKAVPNYCRRKARREPPAPYRCTVTLTWRTSGEWRSPCTGELEATDPRLRPSRYYRIRMTCRVRLLIVGGQLPPVVTTVKR